MNCTGAIAPALAACLILVAGPARAEDVITIPAAVPSDCELHVWPAAAPKRTHRIVYGSGAELIALSKDVRDSIEGETIIATLTPENQIAALRKLPLGTLFGAAKPANVVLHSDGVDPEAMEKNAARYAASQSPCYAELVLRRVEFSRNLYRSDLVTTFWYRDFGAAQAKPGFVRRDGLGKKLELFPLEEGQDTKLPAQELLDVIGVNLAEFARKTTAARRKR